jgi:ATP-dependent RNA helicase MSS116
MQIAKEAWVLSGGPGGDVKVGSVMGGRDFFAEQQELQEAPAVHLLVCTVGRLLDHLNKNSARLRERLAHLHVLVLDEADTLLHTSFRREVAEVLKFLPPSEQRQTLLFSATVPSAIPVEGLIRDDYVMIDTVGEGEAITNACATQHYMIVPLGDTVRTIYSILLHHTTSRERFKVIVFFATARLTQFMSMLFTQVFHLPTMEIHSRRAQDKRTATSDEFRKSSNVILFSSDVSARGMDYEDVSFVLQVGRPSDREQYIHRLGRTARAGKQGEGLLLLAPYDEPFLKSLHGLPILPTTPAEAHAEGQMPETVLTEWKRLVHKRGELKSRAAQAYQSWLGFYNSHRKLLGWDKEELVRQAALFALECLKFSSPPCILNSVAKKMGLGDVASLPRKK